MNSSRNTLAVFAATGFDIGGGESSELKLSMTGSIVNEPGSGMKLQTERECLERHLRNEKRF